MPSEYQESFFFPDEKAPSGDLFDPLSDFYGEIERLWNLPIGHNVKLRLRDRAVPELTGKLKLARLPDFPLDPRQPLLLSLCGLEFTHREVDAWSLC